MVWMVEKKVFYHIFDFGFRQVKVPIRVKFEFQVEEGALVEDSLSFNSLYNEEALAKLYPKIKFENLDQAINETVKEEIDNYLLSLGITRN